MSINSDLDAAWREMGHDVHALTLGAGVYSAPQLLADAPFVPDVLMQKEHLGQRVLLAELDEVTALKAFWSVDTHLNLYWQRTYGRLFDVLFTPHPNFLAEVAAPHPCVRRLAACAHARPFVPHSQRSRPMAFVGRLSTNRILRLNLCRLLHERYQTTAHDNLSFSAMLDLYAATRLLPNESIAMETNFRLLEGASCGCCVLSQDVGDDQDSLFEPGREVLVYGDALEFVDLADRCLADPALSERVGRAAWERVQRDHLPLHRAQAALGALETAPRSALSGQAARDAFNMTLIQMSLGGALPPEAAATALHRLHDPYMRWQVPIMQNLLADAPRDTLMNGVDAVAAALREREPAPTPSEALAQLAVVAGGANLWLERPQEAAFWLRTYEQAANTCPQGMASDTFSTPSCSTWPEACEAWISALLRDGRKVTHGFQYHHGCCQSALDVMLLLAEKDSTGSAWAKQLLADAHIRRIHPHLMLAAHERLALNAPHEPERAIESLAAMLRLFELPRAHLEYAQLLAMAQTMPGQALTRLARKRFGGLEALQTPQGR